jgi:preprotein translocase subunit SecG
MMTFLIVLCTTILILNSLILGLLILIQLPKKEAGVGVAFGGGATDALFGAGSGNALTKLTKYSAISFFCVIVVLSGLNSHARNSAGSKLRENVGQTGAAPEAVAPVAPAAPAGTTAKPSSATNLLQIAPGSNTAPMTSPTNAPINIVPAPSTVTNPPAAPAK